jgi:hypothetical protein
MVSQSVVLRRFDASAAADVSLLVPFFHCFRENFCRGRPLAPVPNLFDYAKHVRRRSHSNVTSWNEQRREEDRDEAQRAQGKCWPGQLHRLTRASNFTSIQRESSGRRVMAPDDNMSWPLNGISN